LLPVAIPGIKTMFVGTTVQMEAVASYNRAARDLQLATTLSGPKKKADHPAQGGEEEAVPSGKGGGRPQAKKKSDK
jgi:hypothetical protein